MLQLSPSHQTKEQSACTSLSSAIIRGDSAPAEKLRIDRWSAEMGLSQIPIRAAIQRLQSEGLSLMREGISTTYLAGDA